MDWEKEFEESFYNSSKNNDYGWLASMMNGGDSGDNIKAFIRTTIQQAVAQERERIVKDVKKMKWKNTPKTMLTSYYNGFIGYHKGDGVHIPHTIGSHEDMQHSHYNEAVEDVINIITNNHEDHKE